MNELLVGGKIICRRFQISRARLKEWEKNGVPIYRRGIRGNSPCCADYRQLLDWERTACAKTRGRLDMNAEIA